MASKESESGEEHLADIFRKSWDMFEELESTSLAYNSSEFQSKVKLAKDQLELATSIVNQVGIFSSNELIDEVSTESLQYLLLPYFLGKLLMKLNQDDRLDVLKIAEIYFKDFLQRCEEYEISATQRKTETEGDTAKEATKTEMEQLMQAARARNDKITNFRLKKDLEERIKELKNVVQSDTVDDEIKREFFLKLLKKCTIEAREELQSLELEKQMVEMRKFEVSKSQESTSKGHSSRIHDNVPSKKKPLQPFIITRDATQKAVFGLGYPSLPVMTVDEFYQQRVDEGIFPDEEKQAKINREKAITAALDPEEQEEAEKAAVEQQVETDDSEYLARMRRMDEYKDVVRRGDGNRHNRS